VRTENAARPRCRLTSAPSAGLLGGRCRKAR